MLKLVVSWLCSLVIGLVICRWVGVIFWWIKLVIRLWVMLLLLMKVIEVLVMRCFWLEGSVGGNLVVWCEVDCSGGFYGVVGVVCGKLWGRVLFFGLMVCVE